MKNILIILSIFCFSVHASELKGDYVIAKSELVYHINFLMKHVVGTSNEAKGKAVCQKNECEFLIAASIKSFVSPDSNRDTNMIDTMKAMEFPMVVVRVKSDATFGKTKKMDLHVAMSGKEVTYKDVVFNVSDNKDEFTGEGRLTFKMSDFGLERPALMMVKIEDEIPVDINVTWKKN